MAIAKMNKVYLIAHQAEKDRLLAILQQCGMMEINDLSAKDAAREPWAEMVETDQEQEALQQLESRLADVRFALDFLQRYFPAKKSMKDSLGGRPAISARELAESAEELARVSGEVYQRLRAADDRLIALRNEETRLLNLKAQLAPWSGLDIPLEEVRATPYSRVETGTLPAAGLSPLRQALENLEAGAYLAEVAVDGGEARVFLAYPAAAAEEVSALLKEHGYNRVSFSGLTGTPAENLARIGDELARAAKSREETLSGAGGQAQYRHQLNLYFDYLSVERDKKQVVAGFARTAKTFVLEGWVRAADLPVLKERLGSLETVEVISREALPGEAFPVALENKRVIAPFEFVTKLYGTPHPYGIDPTFALTPFFFVFFGLCMTDAGYGIVIAALTALALWKLKIRGMARKLLWVIFAGGVSTIIFGALVGGWLGGLIPISPLMFSALDDPMRMLMYALGLGIFQIFTGMAIKFHANVRRGKILDALFDQGLWYVLIIGLLLLALPDLAGIGKIMAIAGAAGLVLTQGRSQPNVIKKFLSGLLSLYNLTGYLSDVLSYSRLLALGLATGVIALTVNTIGGLLSDLGVIGYIIMVPLLIGGHTFNLVINALGSYIHSSRLQYIEFYNRFYEGGGRSFLPFGLKTRHVDVVPEWPESR